MWNFEIVQSSLFYFFYQAKIYFSFPGELLMRILKMLILPLITSRWRFNSFSYLYKITLYTKCVKISTLTVSACSLMSGLSSMDSKACCRMGVLTVTYYLWTTFIAVVVGILLVLIIKPGCGAHLEVSKLAGGQVITSADALLDLVRYNCPKETVATTHFVVPELIFISAKQISDLSWFVTVNCSLSYIFSINHLIGFIKSVLMNFNSMFFTKAAALLQ